MFQVKGLELRKTKAKSILPVQNHGKATGITNHPLHPLAIGKESFRHYMDGLIFIITGPVLSNVCAYNSFLFIALFPPQ